MKKLLIASAVLVAAGVGYYVLRPGAGLMVLPVKNLGESTALGSAAPSLPSSAESEVVHEVRWKQAEPGVVVDSFTGIEWTQRDNLGDVDFLQANTYCKELKLDGGGWDSPTMQELSQLTSGARHNQVPCGDYKCYAPSLFYLTGSSIWSGEYSKSPISFGGYSFTDGRSFLLNTYAVHDQMRALCVRKSLSELPSS